MGTKKVHHLHFSYIIGDPGTHYYYLFIYFIDGVTKQSTKKVSSFHKELENGFNNFKKNTSYEIVYL